MVTCLKRAESPEKNLKASLTQLADFVDCNSDRYLRELMEFCRISSVSAMNLGIEECVDALREKMIEVGLTVVKTEGNGGNPTLIGRLEGDLVGNRIGFYNHYDVQPADPLKLWNFPPFDPTLSNGKVYARGAFDNKGSLIARLCAVDAIRNVFLNVPVGLVFLCEGEEEIGSPNLPKIVRKNRELLKADAFLWEGGGVDEKNRPIISLGFKGILTVRLEAKGASSDAHSYWAPLIPNPAWRLVAALSSMKRADERIRIHGWYDDMIEPSQDENRLVKNMEFDEDAEKGRLGIKEYVKGLTGVESRKALLYGNTCNIFGLNSGYSGPGTKTIVPSVAEAKLDFRLSDGQNPYRQFNLLKEHLQSKGFGDIKITKISECEASKTSPNDPFVGFVSKKLEETYEARPVVLPIMAGTSPMYVIKKWMGTPVVSAGGVGYPESNIHAPNENIRITDFMRSIKFNAALIASCPSFFIQRNLDASTHKKVK